MPRHARLATLAAAGLLLAGVPALLRGQGSTSRQRVLDAMTLPRLASDLRDAGVPDYEVRDALGAMRDARLPAADAVGVLHAEFDARQQHPRPAMEFGVLVREQLRAGLRGKALAAAVARLRAHPPKPRPARELR